MTPLFLDPRMRAACSRAILISGCARSGTTILGKLIHSFKGVEYLYEPSILFALFALLTRLPANEWKLLYETYLHEEFLLNALAGRSLNFNPHDDGFIGAVKGRDEIKRRLAHSLRQASAEQQASSHRIAYKMPDVTPFIPRLMRYYPTTTVVVTTRKASGVIASILKKGWFRESALTKTNEIWPKCRYKRSRIPFFVPEKDWKQWASWDELHRAAYYYCIMNKGLRAIPNRITVRYDDLVAQPKKTVQSLSRVLGLSWGERTEELIAEMHRELRDDDTHPVISSLSPRMRADMLAYSRVS